VIRIHLKVDAPPEDVKLFIGPLVFPLMEDGGAFQLMEAAALMQFSPFRQH
jgi:hypothetical protein